MIIEERQRDDIVALMLGHDSTGGVTRGTNISRNSWTSTSKTTVRPVLAARGHFGPHVALAAINRSISYILFELDLGIGYTVHLMMREFCGCQARVTEVDQRIRSTSVGRVFQCKVTFMAFGLHQVVFRIVVELVLDFNAPQSIVVLEQDVILEVSVLLVASLTTCKILTVPAFVGVASNRKTFA